MNPRSIAEAYDAVVDAYAKVRSPIIGLPYVDKLCDRLPAGGSILDIGCGTGLPLAHRMVSRGFHVHGLDISSRMIEAARRNVPEGTFEQASVVSWTPEHSYDGILAWDSLFHLQPKEHVPALRTLYDALCPGGRVVFSAGGIESEILSSMLGREFYYASLSTREYITSLEDMGFADISVENDQPEEDHVVIMATKEVR